MSKNKNEYRLKIYDDFEKLAEIFMSNLSNKAIFEERLKEGFEQIDPSESGHDIYQFLSEQRILIKDEVGSNEERDVRDMAIHIKGKYKLK